MGENPAAHAFGDKGVYYNEYKDRLDAHNEFPGVLAFEEGGKTAHAQVVEANRIFHSANLDLENADSISQFFLLDPGHEHDVEHHLANLTQVFTACQEKNNYLPMLNLARSSYQILGVVGDNPVLATHISHFLESTYHQLGSPVFAMLTRDIFGAS